MSAQPVNLTDALVFSYLQKRGYSAAAAALPPGAKLPAASDAERERAAAMASEMAVANRITLFEGADDYIGSYQRLRDWVHGSLDLYKPELLELLYPLFVHCYLELLRSRKPELAPALFARFAPEHEAPHGHDLLQLAALRTGEQAATAALAQAFQGSRYAVRLSRYAFELLMAFLQAAGDTLALALINEHLAIKLTAGDAGKLGLGLASEDRAATNVRPGRWGLLRSSPLVRALAPDLAAGDGGEAAAAAAAAAALEDEEQGGKKRKKGAAPPPPPPPPPPPAPKAAGGAPAAPAFTIVEPGLPKAAMPALPELFEQRLLAGTPLLVSAPESVILTLHIPADLRARVKVGPMAKQLPSACMYTLSHAAERACCAALSSSGALLASGFADAQLRVWDMERGAAERAKAAQAAPGAAPGVNGAPPQAVARAAPAAAHQVLTGHAGPVYCCDFTPADDYLLSSGADGTVRLWSVALGGLPLMAYAGHAHPAWCVAAAPAGHYFASGSYDRTARVWALDAPHARRVLVGHAADVDTVAWHPGCSYLASGSADRTVRLWDVASGECVRVLAGLRAPPRSLAFSPDGRSLATGADDGTVALWDLASARCVAEAPGAHGGGVNALAWSAEGALLASAGADASLQLWNPSAGGAVAAAVAGGAAAVLPCAKVLRSKGGQFLTARFTARNLLFAVGSR